MDLDGTVLDETFQPSPRTAAAIATAEAAGIACLIATGRMFVSARRIAEKLAIRRPLVCYQGALVADPVSGEVLVHRPIEAPLARELLRAMPEEHARRSNLYIDDQLYVWEENEATLRYSQVAGVALHIVGPLADWIEQPTTKIVTVGRPEAMDALRDELQPLFGSRAFIAKSLPYFLEFAAPGVSKASGLALLADLLDFTPEQAIAIGDAENDREMLDWAGFGLAVENASDLLKGEADAVIPSVHEDGVAQLLEALAAARG
jgi:Cof subfamily protein (haloacid dehalogenase superfamily)